MRRITLTAMALSTLVSCGDMTDPTQTQATQVRRQALCDSQTTNVLLDTQDKVLSYGARGCTELNGDLMITGAVTSIPAFPTTTLNGRLIIRDSQLEDLGALAQLQVVGDLLVESNARLTTVDLPSATQVGHLHAFDNNTLQSISFGSATSLGGFDVHNNLPLTAIRAESATLVDGNLRIHDQPSLVTLAFDQTAELTGSLDLHNLASFADFGGFANLATLGKDLTLSKLPSLQGLAGLETIETVGGRLGIRANAQLASVEGLSGLTTVGGMLAIVENPNLMALTGLESLTTAQDLVIARLPIPDFAPLSSVTVSDWLRLEELTPTVQDLSVWSFRVRNLALVDVSFLDFLNGPQVQNGGTVRIGQCDNFDDLSSLTGITDLTELYVYNSDRFDFVGITGLESVSRLEISQNARLVAINLPALQQAGLFELVGNGMLTSPVGLGAFERTTWGLEIRYNATMTSLAGLESLIVVGSTLRVENNARLTSLDDVTLNDAGRVQIRNNEMLAACQADTFVARMANAPNSVSNYGNNGTGVCQ